MILILFVVALVIFGTLRVGRRLEPRPRVVLFLASGFAVACVLYALAQALISGEM